MKSVSFVFAILLIAFLTFGCHGGSPQDSATKTYGIVAGDNGLLVCTSTKGKKWSQMDVPEELSQASFSGVAFSPGAPDKVWVVSSRQPPAIMTSADAGKTWSIYEGDLYGCVPDRVEAADTETAWISCDCEDTQPFALKTDDGGETWILQEAGPSISEQSINLELQGLSVVNSQVAWISGSFGSDYGLVFRTVDGGAAWESRVEPEGGDDQLPSDLPYLGVAATSANKAWVVSGHNVNGLHGSSVYHTTDGGHTWKMQAQNMVGGENDLNDISIVEGVIWIAGDNSSAFRSVDGGASWEKFIS